MFAFEKGKVEGRKRRVGSSPTRSLRRRGPASDGEKKKSTVHELRDGSRAQDFDDVRLTDEDGAKKMKATSGGESATPCLVSRGGKRFSEDGLAGRRISRSLLQDPEHCHYEGTAARSGLCP